MTHMIISSPSEMEELGRELGKTEKILLLSGPLGAGKTLLTKGFASSLGIDPKKIQSPTYTYLNIYDKKLLHIDMYRLENFDELIEKGILDMINQYEHIVIERPKRIEKLGLKGFLEIEIEKTDEETRKIKNKR